MSAVSGGGQHMAFTGQYFCNVVGKIQIYSYPWLLTYNMVCNRRVLMLGWGLGRHCDTSALPRGALPVCAAIATAKDLLKIIGGVSLAHCRTTRRHHETYIVKVPNNWVVIPTLVGGGGRPFMNISWPDR